MQFNELSNEERAAVIRTLTASKGWAMFDEFVAMKYEQVRDQFILGTKERHPDMREWTNDKLSGMALGLAFARNCLKVWLVQFDNAERAARELPPEEVGHGNPYGKEADADVEVGR